MRASQELIKQLELLYADYDKEISEKLRAGLLKDTTAKTYLTHSSNFIRWCRNEFVPGERNNL